jgi:hypothetical protein
MGYYYAIILEFHCHESQGYRFLNEKYSMYNWDYVHTCRIQIVVINHCANKPAQK